MAPATSASRRRNLGCRTVAGRGGASGSRGRSGDGDGGVRPGPAERLREAKWAEMMRELQRRRRREKREREERVDSRLNISGEKAWRRRVAMNEPVGPRSPSPPSHGDGFSLGAGGHVTAAQRMMAKMGRKEGQGLGRRSRESPLL